MQKTLTFALAASLFIPISAVLAERIELDQVPEAVMAGVREEHPEARNIRVDKETHFGQTFYELKFKEHGQDEHQTLLDSQGKPFGHEQAVAPENLPAAVKESLRKLFTALQIKDAEIIHDRDGGRVEYEVDVVGDGADWEIVMDPQGKVLTKEPD